MPELRQRVDDAIAAAGSDLPSDRVRHALDAYIADPGSAGAVILLSALTDAVGDRAAHIALGLKVPSRKDLVYCCTTEGWTTPAKRDAHVYDYSFGWD